METYSKTLEWEPLVHDNKLESKILTILDEVSEGIYTRHDKNSPGLMNGTAGTSLFWEYYHQLTGIKNYRKYSFSLVSESLKAMQNPSLPYNFAGGQCGIAWVYNHLILSGKAIQTRLLNEQTTKEFILKEAMVDMAEKQYDYLHGPLGSVLYFLLLKTEKYALDALNTIVGEMKKNVVKFPEGLAWEDTFNPKYMDNLPAETIIYNLGMAHGMSSIIALFASILETDVATTDILNLLNGCINWILAHKKKGGDSFFFPTIVGLGGGEGRLAWCYGDLGFAVALLRAGMVTDNKAWKDKAIEIALNSSLMRGRVEFGVSDAGLCHGSSGLFHIFNRLHHYTDREEFKTAASYWLMQTIELYEETPIKFKRYFPDQEKKRKEDYIDAYGLLEGTAGIGLALISAISDIEPKWDACLLLS